MLFLLKIQSQFHRGYSEAGKKGINAEMVARRTKQLTYVEECSSLLALLPFSWIREQDAVHA